MVTEQPFLRVERRDDGVVLATLDRPKVNALNTDLLLELEALAVACAEDPPGSVVVTGAGRMFAAGAELAGIVVAVDRQERGTGELSAVDEVRRDLGVPVEAIVTFDHVIEYLEESGRHAEHLQAARAYRDQYGA